MNSIRDIHSEMLKKQEMMDNLNEELEEMKNRITQNEKDIRELKEKNFFDVNSTSNTEGDEKSNSQNAKQFNIFGAQINDLRDKLNLLTQKVNHNVEDIKKNSEDIDDLAKED